MPKKLNFLGGQQNYDPKTGEYEPALKGPNGESPSGFKSFKKGDSKETSKTEYFKHPQVDGVWHDTGETIEKNGKSYKMFENEQGGKWAVSDEFSKQFKPFDKNKETDLLSKDYLDKFYELAGGDEDKMLDLIRNDPAYRNYDDGDPNSTWSMGDLEGVVGAYFMKKNKGFEKPQSKAASILDDLSPEEKAQLYYEWNNDSDPFDPNSHIKKNKNGTYTDPDGEKMTVEDMGFNLEERIKEMDEEDLQEFNDYVKGFKDYYKKGDKFEKSYQKNKDKGYDSDHARMLANQDARDTSEDERLQKIIDERIKRGYDSQGTYDPQAIQDLGYLGFGSLEELEKHTFGEKSSFDQINDKRMGKKKPEFDTSTQKGKSQQNELIAKSTEPGKIIKYHPFIRTTTGNEGFHFSEPARAKMLNNGLAMETKQRNYSGMFYKNAKGQYENKKYYTLIDVETGLVCGRVDNYEEGLAKTNDADFINTVNRARNNFKQKHKEYFEKLFKEN